MCYGGMSMQPIAIPAPLLIFKDLRVRGFWLTGGFAKVSKPGVRWRASLQLSHAQGNICASCSLLKAKGGGLLADR